MTDLLSVILPTFNPDMGRLNKTIAGLKNQTLPFENWELIIIDNNSTQPVDINLNWHPNHTIVKETKPGLTYARLKGFNQAKGNVIVMVDDDNILDADYLKNTLVIFAADEKLGAIGGKSAPQFETTPPIWLKEFYVNLALRDLGDSVLIARQTNNYPHFAPIGAGMGIRKLALNNYIKKCSQGIDLIGDRTGKSLASGGDNDIVLEILAAGWQVGYYPILILQHIIPKQRTSVDYLARLMQDMNQSWVQVLEKHHINPWKPIPKWSVPLRKIKSWLTLQAWKNPSCYLRWKSSCGLFDGLAVIKNNAKA